MKCAAYARFSSDKQKQISIDDQLRHCRDFAENRGWQLLAQHTYTDSAVSGVTAHRAGLSALLAAVGANGARAFDCVLVDDTSRISRNLADALRFYERLTFAGVRVVAVSQGVDSTSEQAELVMGVHGLIDSVYSRELAAKTHRGMEGIALRGLATGGRCFGYRTLEARGEKRLAVHEPEAAVVRRIFAMSTEGVGVHGIAQTLNGERVPSPQPYRGQRHASWAASAVSVMLRNERYAGRLVWNRTRKLRNPESGRRIQRLRPRSEWIVTPAENLRIVTDGLFAGVQMRLERMRGLCGGS
ncbi:MAG: recombinase family protein, partial [Burkholderiales bacterium]